MLVTRSFVYKRRIKVSPTDLELARSGRKTCTIRLGTLGVDGARVDLTDGRNALPVRIVSVDTGKCYKDLREDHANNEGFGTLDELKNDLERYYGEIDPIQPITIISFELAP
jgi:hypothetical protein